MNIKKTNIKQLLMLFILMFSFNVSAEVEPFVVTELESSNIKLAKDGTGIVKGIECSDCDFNYVRITPSSRATMQGVEVSILEVRNLVNRVVMVSYNPETREVQYIRW
jgi:hypothetical protein